MVVVWPKRLAPGLVVAGESPNRPPPVGGAGCVVPVPDDRFEAVKTGPPSNEGL